jgi:hypothetical protein
MEDMPDVVRASQRQAGNRAVTGMLERGPRAALQPKPPGPTAPQKFPFDPTAHPEWPLFRDALTKLPPPDKQLSGSDIESVWETVLLGIQDDTPEARAWTWASAVEKLRALLSVTPGQRMALWSGGFDVSVYADGRGFSTLEHTAAGRVFESLELYRDWAIIGELWNALSRAFVDGAQGEVHVFMRTHDPTSVLLAQEVPGVKDHRIAIRWHVLFGEALADIREIDAHGELVDDASFDDEATARAALKDFIVRRRRWSSEPNTAAAMNMD